MKISTLLMVTSVYLNVLVILETLVNMPWQIILVTLVGGVGIGVSALHEICNHN